MADTKCNNVLGCELVNEALADLIRAREAEDAARSTAGAKPPTPPAAPASAPVDARRPRPETTKGRMPVTLELARPKGTPKT